jgi:putative ABC transport system substrate-binding protein
MRRRHFLAVVGLVIFPSPFAVRAQEAKRRPLIVWYGSGPPAAPRKFINALLDGLRELGDIEGQDFEMTYRFGDNRPELLPGLAAETISLKPAIIVAAAVDTAVEVKKLTSTIPVVSGALADAIHLGLVANYARPGGNVTGITPYLPDLPAKQMQIAREIVPGAAKNWSAWQSKRREGRTAARRTRRSGGEAWRESGFAGSATH